MLPGMAATRIHLYPEAATLRYLPGSYSPTE